jgi:hypothetical protein
MNGENHAMEEENAIIHVSCPIYGTKWETTAKNEKRPNYIHYTALSNA